MSRRLEALRNLAERPGTPAEGEVARRLYECEKSKQGRKPSSLGVWALREHQAARADQTRNQD